MSSKHSTSSSTKVDFSNFKNAKKSFFEIMLKMMDTGQSSLSILTGKGSSLIMEIIYYFLWAIFSLRVLFANPNAPNEFKQISSFIFALVDPISIALNPLNKDSIPLFLYITLVLIATFVVLAVLVFAIVGLQIKGDTKFTVFAFCARILRTVLYVPLAFILLSPLRCDLFDYAALARGELNSRIFSNTSCLTFPHLLFLILCPLLFVFLFLVSLMDVFFLLDKLKSVKYPTAEIDGRVNTATFLVLNVQILLTIFFEGSEYFFIVGVAGFTLHFLVFLASLRVFPCFNPYFFLTKLFIQSISLSAMLAQCFISVLGNIWWAQYIILISFAAFFLISLLSVVFRLIIIFFYYNKKNLLNSDFKMNLFFNFFSFDSAMIVFFHSREGDDYKKIIAKLIGNMNFIKTKEMCIHFTSFIIERDSSLAHLVLNHSKGLSTSFVAFDVDFASHFYQTKLQGQESGGTENSKKIAKGLIRIEKLQTSLRHMLRTFWSNLIDKETANLRGLPLLLESVEDYKNTIEMKYQEMIKIYPSRSVFSSYAKYLLEFCGDKEKSNFFEKEAKSNGNNSGSLDGKFSEEEASQESKSDNGSDGGGEPKVQSAEMEENVETGGKLKEGGKSESFASLDKKAPHTYASTFNSSSTSSAISSLRKTVNNSFYLSVFTLRSLLFIILLTIFCLSVAFFVLFYVVKAQNTNREILLTDVARIQRMVTSASHFARKIQNCVYPHFLEGEKNTTNFVNLMKSSAMQLDQYFMDIYPIMDRTPWLVQVDVAYAVSKNFSLNGNVANSSNYYITKKLTLLESVIEYTHRANEIVLMNESFIFNTTSFISTTAFIYVTLNENRVVSGLTNVQSYLFSSLQTSGMTYMYLLFFIPCLLVPEALMLIVTFLCLYLAQKESLEGLLLIPRDKVIMMYEKFGGVSVIEDHANNGITNTNNNNNNATVADSGKKELSTTYFQFSSIVRVSLIGGAVVIIFFFFLFISSLINYFLTTIIDDRDVQFRYTTDIKNEIRRIHMWITEYVWRQDTYFSVDDVVQGIRVDINLFDSLLKNLRFGSNGVSGLDQNSAFFNLFYETKCTNQQILSCQSTSVLSILFIDSVERLLEKNSSNGALLGSEDYANIITLDNIGTAMESGILQTRFLEIQQAVAIQSNTLQNVFENYSYILLFIVCPIITVAFFLFLYSFPSKIQSELSSPRSLMFLLPNSDLMETNIYKFIRGISKANSIFREGRKKFIENMYSVFKSSAYAIVFFDDKLRVLSSNNSFSDLFGIRDVQYLSAAFTEEGRKSINGWVRTKNDRFSTKLTGLCNGVEFTVVCEFTRFEGCHVGIIENIDSSKKKDMLREAEKQSEETEKLLRNMLPEEVIPVFKEIVAGNSGKNNIERKVFVNYHKSASAIFGDIVNFTGMSLSMDPNSLVAMLNDVFVGIDDIISTSSNLEKIKTIGDCYFCVSGAPQYTPTHALNAVKFGIEVLKFLRKWSIKNQKDLTMRIGISSGPFTAGIIGKIKYQYDVWGATINESARLEANGLPSKLNVSRDTYAYVFESYAFTERKINVQGIGLLISYVHTPTFDDSVLRKEIEEEKLKNNHENCQVQSDNTMKKPEQKIPTTTITSTTIANIPQIPITSSTKVIEIEQNHPTITIDSPKLDKNPYGSVISSPSGSYPESKSSTNSPSSSVVSYNGEVINNINNINNLNSKDNKEKNTQILSTKNEKEISDSDIAIQ